MGSHKGFLVSPILASLRPPASAQAEALRADLGVRFLGSSDDWLRSQSGQPENPVHLPQSAGQINSRLVSIDSPRFLPGNMMWRLPTIFMFSYARSDFLRVNSTAGW
jgi:hypothetical protein